eukprot:2743931-Amphidinium_carterae.1
MAALSAEIAIRCEQAHVEFTAEHVRSNLNCEADALSSMNKVLSVPLTLKSFRFTRLPPARGHEQ